MTKSKYGLQRDTIIVSVLTFLNLIATLSLCKRIILVISEWHAEVLRQRGHVTYFQMAQKSVCVCVDRQRQWKRRKRENDK